MRRLVFTIGLVIEFAGFVFCLALFVEFLFPITFWGFLFKVGVLTYAGIELITDYNKLKYISYD